MSLGAPLRPPCSLTHSVLRVAAGALGLAPLSAPHNCRPHPVPTRSLVTPPGQPLPRTVDVVMVTAAWGWGSDLASSAPLQLPFSKSPCSHGNRFSKYLSPPGAGQGRGPQHHLRGGPAIRAPSPPQAVSLPHPPPRAPPRFSGDQRTRVSRSLSCWGPSLHPLEGPRSPGPQLLP